MAIQAVACVCVYLNPRTLITSPFLIHEWPRQGPAIRDDRPFVIACQVLRKPSGELTRCHWLEISALLLFSVHVGSNS